MLPSGMNTPWAGSNRYKDFGAQYHSQPGGHARSVHPHVLSVYASNSDFDTLPYTLPATLDTGPLAKSYPGGITSRLSTSHFQFARSPVGYLLIILLRAELTRRNLCEYIVYVRDYLALICRRDFDEWMRP